MVLFQRVQFKRGETSSLCSGRTYPCLSQKTELNFPVGSHDEKMYSWKDVIRKAVYFSDLSITQHEKNTRKILINRLAANINHAYLKTVDAIQSQEILKLNTVKTCLRRQSSYVQ